MALDAVIDAAAELKRRGRPDIKLVLIGDGKCKDALVARAQREGLDNCLFFPPMKKTEIARITASFNCGLQILADIPAFYYGTSPNKFFDYISAGLPVVNNYPGWLAELIRENNCGMAVPPRNPPALAACLISLADAQKLCDDMGHNARGLAQQKFNRTDLSRRWVAVIEACAPADSGRVSGQ